ncbi:MAG TPA: sulfite exporter TauE/SafE family protein [Bradyrhizobium sp.]|uniref:sulfite exporter TauE/SafE family protein n=1 Tax=Bradyrhizobium sp. TaxID=376 RepID=UPI002BFE9CB9|nr:sulfite exporter TauE/SafE family protein [Bradyrhizobium sp.]HLZ02317.1 sulfite exporter TauE/SafE family protein [Bradyrhizobium sp.]
MHTIDPFLLIIGAIFLLAGFIKGVIGLGLPTVSVSLLAVAMPPGQALAIVILPAIITNIWQTFVGPYLRDIVRRLWPLMIGTAIGIWLNSGALTGASARYGVIVLGILLVIYAVMGLSRVRFSVAPGHEKWVGGIVGLTTGVISAATGVQVIPSMPFMQAIGMEKDELIQALGVFFTVATLALGFTLTRSGLLSSATAVPGAVAMACSFTGVFVGQAVRSRMDAERFRRWFLIAMILLGLYLAGSAIYELYLA